MNALPGAPFIAPLSHAMSGHRVKFDRVIVGVESNEVIRMQERLKTLQEVEALSEQERVEYWASRTPNERHAAAWEMTIEHYRKLGLWHEGQQMDKTITRRIVGRDAWRAAEESKIG